MPFANREDAGRRLGDRVAEVPLEDPVVVGLPRGGVPVAAEVAKALGAPLDVLVVRKLGTPWQPELGMGAVAEGGARMINDELVESLGIGEDAVEEVAEQELAELERRVRRYRGDRPREPLAGRTVVLVDDGLATGSSVRTAVEALRQEDAGRIVLAVPVAPPSALDTLREIVDEAVCLETPAAFRAVGAHYEDFEQTTDDEVQALLAEAAGDSGGRADAASAGRSDAGAPGQSGDSGAGSAGRDEAPIEEHEVEAGPLGLPGILRLPDKPLGVVAFAHGSGSGRLSPRNTAVARDLGGAGLATLLFDLLTEEESADRRNVFDIPLLGQRLLEVTRWVRDDPRTEGLPVGFFGASTGAAAALRAAAELGDQVRAVVSRGGRPDLAEDALPRVAAPTLLIVGGRDPEVLELNRAAARELRCEHEVEVVFGATHLFEEPGALEQVSELARDWFARHLPA